MNQNPPLRRDPKRKILLGVCAGLARYLNLDVVIVRLICILLLIFGTFFTFIIYILLAAMMPVGPEYPAGVDAPYNDLRPDAEEASASGKTLAGVLLVTLGFILLISNYFHWWSWRKLWPVVLIALGLYILFMPGQSVNDDFDNQITGSDEQNINDQTDN